MSFENPGTNPFLDTADDNLSTFALDVDTASYTVARNYLLSRELLPPADAIRPEEFVNYFDAGYDSPGGDDAFAIYLDAAPAPFGFEDHQLLRVGIQGRYVAPEDRDPVFLVFVIDVSGSMDMENRLGLVKESLSLLLDELREDDRIGIVVYSDNSRAVLQPTPASERTTIDAAINTLRPEGSTNVQAGLQIGYDMATENMREGENTRVVVLSDGVANVGITEGSAMLKTIEASVEQGVTLSTIGFGLGNYNDVLMEELANNGDGNYYYVDEIKAARRVFVHNLTGTLQVIGYDAKIQVDFNPDVTDRYRLIGYENRAIADEDFRNDEVDAGEVGAGQSVTALYELAYEDGEAGQRVAADDVIATVYVRYEDAETREVVEISRSIRVEDVLADIEDAPATFRLHAAVVEFAELLRGSFWAEDGTYGNVLRLAESAQADLNGDATLTEDVDEFVAMVRSAIRAEDQ
jgi:Ca-activated chloride channel homolog